MLCVCRKPGLINIQTKFSACEYGYQISVRFSRVASSIFLELLSAYEISSQETSEQVNLSILFTPYRVRIRMILTVLSNMPLYQLLLSKIYSTEDIFN